MNTLLGTSMHNTSLRSNLTSNISSSLLYRFFKNVLNKLRDRGIVLLQTLPNVHKRNDEAASSYWDPFVPLLGKYISILDIVSSVSFICMFDLSTQLLNAMKTLLYRQRYQLMMHTIGILKTEQIYHYPRFRMMVQSLYSGVF